MLSQNSIQRDSEHSNIFNWAVRAVGTVKENFFNFQLLGVGSFLKIFIDKTNKFFGFLYILASLLLLINIKERENWNFGL